MIDRQPPDLNVEQTRKLIERWLTRLEGLELVRSAMPAGATLEDALALHRRLRQIGRRPSRVMSEEP